MLCAERPAIVLHPVGTAIEGKYSVYLHSDLIGHLNLKDGEYSYTPAQNGRQVTTEDIVGRFFFIQYPGGRYSRDYYYDAVKQDTPLEDLGRYALLLFIHFDVRETAGRDSTTTNSPYLERVFVVCTDGENRTIFFQRLASEFQMWGVAKPWD